MMCCEISQLDTELNDRWEITIHVTTDHEDMYGSVHRITLNKGPSQQNINMCRVDQ